MKHSHYAVLALLIAIVLSPLPSPAALTETCLTGTAPDVANDVHQIRAVRALIDAACGCSTFDSGPGHTHGRYVTCATTIINAQAAARNLRTQCKRTVTAYYRNSTCGRNPLLHPEPCVQTNVRTGSITCAIKATTRSNGTPATSCTTTARTTRVACPAYRLCIDAADTNGNLIIAAPDSGMCVCPPVGPAVLQTGQTQCDQGSGDLGVCPGLPAGQDGSVLKGAVRSYTDNGDGTVTDNTTGLMWEKLSQDGSIHDYGTIYPWNQAFTIKIATLNSGGGFAGHTDWRLPNVNELRSIVNYQSFWPAVDTAFNTGCVAGCTVTGCNCTHQEFYWSSTTAANAGLNAWGVFLDGGQVSSTIKGTSAPVRAVRGGL